MTVLSKTFPRVSEPLQHVAETPTRDIVVEAALKKIAVMGNTGIVAAPAQPAANYTNQPLATAS